MVSPHECHAPALTLANARLPATGKGRGLHDASLSVHSLGPVGVPVPSCPEELVPQQYALPVGVNAHECPICPPALMTVHCSDPVTRVGAVPQETSPQLKDAHA